jgi:hypothetical protein
MGSVRHPQKNRIEDALGRELEEAACLEATDPTAIKIPEREMLLWGIPCYYGAFLALQGMRVALHCMLHSDGKAPAGKTRTTWSHFALEVGAVGGGWGELQG